MASIPILGASPSELLHEKEMHPLVFIACRPLFGPTQARGAAATAREDAAQLRGQADTLQAQNAELMEALKLRESGRSDPKGGKKST